jgi:hypothetical protein
MKRGRKPVAAHLEELRLALRNLHDPIALEELSLAQTRLVRARAERDFARRTCGVGLATSSVLSEALAEIGESLAALTPLAKLAEGLRAGRTQAEVAAELGLSDEQLSRHWKPKLLKVLYERLQMLNREVDELAPIREN